MTTGAGLKFQGCTMGMQSGMFCGKPVAKDETYCSEHGGKTAGSGDHITLKPLPTPPPTNKPTPPEIAKPKPSEI